MKLDILKILQELNFTEYKTKTYLALLGESRLTGYVVALNSSLPSFRIYQVLAELTEPGLNDE
ncbi:helix-turn-helix domain-containing protein [Clostridium thailandense]|uniref:helix-turn-helix domain-containing protein n=1 Tax=Clostridium thailandense TaxID=2794346 RepID=UPI003989054E